MLTQERLKALVNYDPETGIFTWIVCPSNCVKVGDVAGHLRKNGYVEISIDGVKYGAPRLAWLWMTGSLPVAMVDHENGIHHDNRWENLREATNALNTQNQRKSHRDNKTGLLGASPHGNRFQAQIVIDGKNHYLGIYETADLAHAAYVEAKRRIHPACTI